MLFGVNNMITSEFLNKLPMQPGIYIMKNKNDKVIYVGKAKLLKNRVKQYFVNSSSHTPKVMAMVENVDHIDYIVTNSEAEALNLECSFIKKYRPKYNILLKDDKMYPYIKITDEEFPRILMVRRKDEDNSKYYGPFVNTLAVKTLLEVLKKTFKIRDCSKAMFGKNKKPCLNYHIKKCLAPCVGNIDRQTYMKNIEQVISVLNGDFKTLIYKLQDEMQKASQKLNFEAAAEYRDKISAIRKIQNKQLVVGKDSVNEDYIALARKNLNDCIQVLSVRDGKLIDKSAYFMKNCEQDSDEDIISAFIKQHYAEIDIPKAIYTSVEADAELAGILSDCKGKKVVVKRPLKGDKSKFIEMAYKNAIEEISVKEISVKSKDNPEALEQLKYYLKLDFIPKRIEAYDVSNTAGSLAVASMVVFEDGKPSKKSYRKFKISFSEKADDYGSMREVIYRRLKRAEQKDEKFLPLPDLIFVDGGKGQITAAMESLSSFEYKIPVYGIVKDDKHRTKDIISKECEYNIPVATKCFKLVASMQDEMHNSAISYHKKLRYKKNIQSSLLNIDGVGKQTYKLLMKEFKTIQRISNASYEEIASIKGINKNTARNIYMYYHNEKD